MKKYQLTMKLKHFNERISICVSTWLYLFSIKFQASYFHSFNFTILLLNYWCTILNYFSLSLSLFSGKRIIQGIEIWEKGALGAFEFEEKTFGETTFRIFERKYT